MRWRIDKALGYMYSIDKSSPYASKNGRIWQHHYVMCEHIGRPLRDDECVHHIDRNRANNDLGNLMLMTKSEHSALHAREDGRLQPREGIVCASCGGVFVAQVGGRRKFCSVACSDAGRQVFSIDADSLAALVLEKPLRDIARELGVSDVAVAKRCKKFGIQRPGRGHWASVRSRQNTPVILHQPPKLASQNSRVDDERFDTSTGAQQLLQNIGDSATFTGPGLAG